jgi:hypothetical protein
VRCGRRLFWLGGLRGLRLRDPRGVERGRRALPPEEAVEEEAVEGAKGLLLGESADGDEFGDARRRVEAREDEALLGLERQVGRELGGPTDDLAAVGKPRGDELGG